MSEDNFLQNELVDVPVSSLKNEGIIGLDEIVATIYGGIRGTGYRGNILLERDILLKNLNSFSGNAKDISILKGDIAEYWHGGTFNIKAAQLGNNSRVYVPRSNEFGSTDIASNFGKKFGLKYYKTGSESAKQQAKSIYERLKDMAKGDDKILKKLLEERGLTEQMLNDPMYAGQVRIIPKDQLQEAKAWLERKIAEESAKRPEQVARYKETLKMLDDRLRDGAGTESIALSKEEAEKLAKMIKKGEITADAIGMTDAELIKMGYVIKQAAVVGLEAAAVSAAISLIMGCYKKYKGEGKKLYEFTWEDWKEVGGDTLFHAATAGISAGTLFVVGSFCEAAVPGVSALLMALFGIAALVPDYVNGKITKEEFVVQSEMVCLQAAFILLGTSIGTIVGGPIGALVGAVAASIAWFLIDRYLGEELKELCEAFNKEIEKLLNMAKSFFESIWEKIKNMLEHIELMLDKDFDIKLQFKYKKTVVKKGDQYVLIDSNISEKKETRELSHTSQKKRELSTVEYS